MFRTIWGIILSLTVVLLMITSNGVNESIIELLRNSQQDLSIDNNYSELPVSTPTEGILDISGESNIKQSFTRPISENNPDDVGKTPIPNLTQGLETESKAEECENGAYDQADYTEQFLMNS